MDIDGPTFVPKSGFLTCNFGQGLSQKVAFFFIFEQVVQPVFLDKMLALSNKKPAFLLVSGFSGCCIFTVLSKYYLKVACSPKRHLKLP